MNEERIAWIEKARTLKELSTATEGYREQALAAHPALRANGVFNVAMRAHSYFDALEQVRHAVLGRGDRYQDVIRVLECATDKQFVLAKEHRFRWSR
jgi:hypothetical protein